jgi:two-component system, NtrC family, nitrogen regulation sensor histidine kinase NtrY
VQKKSKHIFLVLAVVSVLAALLSYFYFEKGALSAPEEKYLVSIKERVKYEVEWSRREMNAVAKSLKDAPKINFSAVQKTSRYPYFVFKNGQLLFWSDYRFIPEFEQIKSVSQVQLVDFEQGKYLVSRQRVINWTDTLDLFSVIDLYRKYKRENNYLQSSYNPTLFTTDPAQISAQKGLTYRNIFDNQNRFLFSVVPPKIGAYNNQTVPVNTIIWSSLAVLFVGIYVITHIIRLNRQRRYELAFVILSAYLLIVRAGMLYFEVPFLFYETDLFNSKFYFSHSFLSPSLGDLLLNYFIGLAFLLYITDTFYRSKTYFNLIHQSEMVKTVVSVICVVGSYAVFYFCFVELNNIYQKSAFTLDITLSISFSNLKIACLLIFICISSIYFLLSSLIIRFHRKNRWRGWWIVTAGSVLSGGLFLAFGIDIEWILLVHTLYLLVLYGTTFPRMLYAFRYKTSIYYFVAALFCAIVTTYVVYVQEQNKDILNKKEFGKQIIAENDGWGELLLDRANESIRQDLDIQKTLLRDTVLSREKIQQKVKSIHLDRYFDKYVIEVLSFKANGQPIDNLITSLTYDEFVAPYRQAKYQTERPNIYFVNDVINNFNKQYLSLIDVRRDTALVGRLVLNLQPLNDQPKNVYPELLMDQKFIQPAETRQYSYAIYDLQKNLLYNTGSYNYERKLSKTELSNPLLYERGISINDYKHVGDLGKNGRRVVVSSKEYAFKNVFSNFSFLYLILVVYVICIIGIYVIKYGFSKLKISYTTKIQILLNGAFFVPLSLIVVITLSVISSNYVTNQENAYLSNTKNVAANFVGYLQEYLKGSRSRASMEEELGKIARDAAIDINFFDTNGLLFATTKPLIYESGLLSKRLNPESYIRLVEDKENEVLLSESLGNKQYRSAYVTAKTANGKILGVLSVPYFDSKPDLDRQIIEVIASVLSIFAGMFLVFLLLSYWASNTLTVPLRMMTQKIRRINLQQLDEPVEWKSDDEIGVLVGAYNRMLQKLEDSKQDLANNEKMHAWREMAKQVAHEIKNPLTPMKLTIQQLQRTTARDLPNSERITRTFDSLIDQIDNISDIATSFSDFAKMPLPKNELFEVASVLGKAADLHAEDSKILLRREIQSGEFMVMGDRQLTGRIITNLIINGIQSAQSVGRRPEITLHLHSSDGNVYVEVKDNGAGIPEAIRPKVFFPNFTTRGVEGGTGLGLAIAKRGIEQSGGTIWFETEEGTGTTFFISLPLAN